MFSLFTDDLVLIDPDTAQDDPCAFLVKVFMDPENPNSTAQRLKWFEWNTPIVRESSGRSQ